MPIQNDRLTDTIGREKTLALQQWAEFPDVHILRGDQLHPVVSGNKLFKLEPLLAHAVRTGRKAAISVGGRYSNHLHALSWAARESGLDSIGLIRGFPEQPLTPTLQDCQEWGMQLHFIPPGEYRKRHLPAFWQPWLTAYPDSIRIDEGGWSAAAIEGSARWWHYIPGDARNVVCAVGSGCTLAGLLSHVPQGVRVVAVPVYRDRNAYAGLLTKLVHAGIDTSALALVTDLPNRGFGKLTGEQRQFKNDFEHETGIPLDPVYTTKVLHAVRQQLLQSSADLQGKTVVIHTGGLQGNRQG